MNKLHNWVNKWYIMNQHFEFCLSFRYLNILSNISMFSKIITTHYKIILCKHLNIFHINVNKNIYPSIGRIRTKNKKILHFIPWHKRHKIILWHFISVTHGWKRNSFQFSSAWCVKVILYIRVTKIVYVQIRNILICSFSWICIGDSL